MNERIKIVRKSANLSQEKFAEKLGLTRTFIVMLESGQREPSDRTLKDICQKFFINEEWLRTGEGQMEANVEKSAEIAQIASAMFNMGENDPLYIVMKNFCKFLASMDEDQLQKLVDACRNIADEVPKKDA